MLADPADLPAPEEGAETQPAAGHGHLWRLADGTGLHAPPGRLARQPTTGLVCCHLCGEWFRALGMHVRCHGHDAASYKDAVGLPTTASLSSEAERNAKSARQRRVYRPDALAAGRATVERRRRAERQELLRAAGSPTLADHLRRRYAEGIGLDDLAGEVRLTRTETRAALRAAGLALRPPGRNTRQGQLSRVRNADEEAAMRVGTADLRSWLLQRRSEGWSLRRLGRAVGHNESWVRRRL